MALPLAIRLSLCALLISTLVAANIERVPLGAIVHCVDPDSYCVQFEGPATIDNTRDENAYGACEYDKKGQLAGNCVFLNNNMIPSQSVEVTCKDPGSKCGVTLGNNNPANQRDEDTTRFECFGLAKAAWTGEGDTETPQGHEAGIVFAKAKGDNSYVRCPAL